MNKVKKVGLIVFILLVLASALVTFFYIKISNDLESLGVITIDDVDMNQVTDGSYIGEYQVFPIHVIVQVEISDHLITNITIVEHDNGQGDDAETIVDDVMTEQSLQVDAIAGATYSSKVILLAIQDALTKAIS